MGGDRVGQRDLILSHRMATSRSIGSMDLDLARLTGTFVNG
jgi:hypothetical protein